MNYKEKRKLLAKLVELYVANGIEIDDLIGRPLSFFDFEKIQESIRKYENDH